MQDIPKGSPTGSAESSMHIRNAECYLAVDRIREPKARPSNILGFLKELFINENST